MLARGDNGPADPAWLRDRLSDGKCLKIAILSFSTGKIAVLLLYMYSSFYGSKPLLATSITTQQKKNKKAMQMVRLSKANGIAPSLKLLTHSFRKRAALPPSVRSLAFVASFAFIRPRRRSTHEPNLSFET